MAPRVAPNSDQTRDTQSIIDPPNRDQKKSHLPPECRAKPKDFYSPVCHSSSFDKAVRVARKFGVPVSPRRFPQPHIFSENWDAWPQYQLRRSMRQPHRPNLAIVGDHNRAYYQWRLAFEEKDIKLGGVLIYFDTHDDLESPDTLPPSGGFVRLQSQEKNLKWDDWYTDSKLLISSYIAPAVYEGLLSEVYWVLPDWAPRGSLKGGSYWGDFQHFVSPSRFPDESGWEPEMSEGDQKLYGSEKDIKFYVGKVRYRNGVRLYFSPVKPRMEDVIGELREMTVHKVYKEELPNFSDEKRSVLVSIDQDWLNNTGYDTIDFITPDLKLAAAKTSAKELIKTLKSKGIKPDNLTIITSPEYTFTDQIDDTTAVLVNEILKLYLMDKPEFIEGQLSYSENTYQLASALTDFIKDNMKNDPRLQDWEVSVRDFNNEIVLRRLKRIDETKHLASDDHSGDRYFVQNRHTPDEDHFTFATFRTKRGDYSPYLKVINKYGLETLAGVIRHLQTFQNQKDTPVEDLKWAYLLALRVLWQITQYPQMDKDDHSVLE